ncbi:tripartite motif-containing protein 42 [Alligator mississippiensis]|uniref:tripartite motif-containing protein 42 n=1 Tax=Alligator mississippiensis TaxID=8496 RepID=UPI0009076BC7|nr:tripartite motif-containing protein 42 [Alligator mississippiensis]
MARTLCLCCLFWPCCPGCHCCPPILTKEEECCLCWRFLFTEERNCNCFPCAYHEDRSCQCCHCTCSENPNCIWCCCSFSTDEDCKCCCCATDENTVCQCYESTCCRNVAHSPYHPRIPRRNHSRLSLPGPGTTSDTSVITLDKDVSGHSFRDQLTCPACKQLYLHPFMLPCKHCVCGDCIGKRRAKAEVSENFFILICPVCNKAHCLPYSNKIQLKKNLLRAKLAKRYMQKHGLIRWRFDRTQTSIYCQACKEKKRKASKRCLTCQMNFCKECLSLYHRDDSAQEHIFTKAYQEDQEQSNCLVHSSSPISEYCVDDHELICDYCKNSLHSDHETLPLIVACSREAGALFNAIAKFKKVRYGVDNDLLETFVLKNNFKSYKDTKRKEIRNGFLRLRSILHEREKEMMELLENLEFKKQRGITEYMEHASKKLAYMDSLLQYSKEALKEENQIAFLQSSNSLVNEIEDAITNIYQPNPCLREDPIQNLKLNFEELSTNLNGIFPTSVRIKQSDDKVNKYPYPCNSGIIVPKRVSSTHLSKPKIALQSPSLTSLYDPNVLKKEMYGRPKSTPPLHPKQSNKMFACWDTSEISRKETSPSIIHSPEMFEDGSLTAPGLVIIYQTLAYPKSAKIYWTCPTEDVDFFDVEFYEVIAVTTDNVIQTQLAGQLSGIKHQNLEIHNLDPSTEYLFKVRAVNSNGTGQWSEICKVMTPDDRGKVQGRWGLLRSIQSSLHKEL